MCGVIGIVGQESVAPLLVSSLLRLEYRGYDSAGVATVTDGQLHVRKGVGAPEDVCQHLQIESLPGSIGIGHTRWATHGEVTSANAHPHTDCFNMVAVVHNGVIENHQQLRSDLSSRHTFVSNTDTEVIAHLIEEALVKVDTLEEAVGVAVSKLRGSYALLAVSSFEPDKIVAARRDSPLVVGLNGSQSYVASDIVCLHGNCDRVTLLDDGEIATLSSNDVVFRDCAGKAIDRTFSVLNSNWEGVSLQKHKHYMLKEIDETPQAIRRALAQDDRLLSESAIDILRARQVIVTGSGTSRYASIIGRYLFSRLGGTFCDVVLSSEFHYFSDAVDRSTMVIAVSQSGETADTVYAARSAKEKGASVISIANTVGSSLPRIADRALYLNCGPEICVAATKSFLSQLTVFYLLAFAMSNRLEEGKRKLVEMADCLESCLKENGTGTKEVAQQTAESRDFYYLARGINYAVAGEGALKMKEVSYVHAEGMPAGELKHGTLALVTKDTPVVVICPRDYTFEETLTNASEVRARGAFVIGVSDVNNPLFDAWIRIPEAEEVFYPILCTVPLQQLAYHAAVARGLNPDRPRNLAKSVTVR